ncbi:hypothetical protein J4466_04600 [Candidatus Pacearchaeota archaeon]|nr:hypothetical protein [Candidatus Pacearchaeota archaeon]
MRIKLKDGKQEELIIKAKSVKSWSELAEILNINAHYLEIELRNEKRLLSDKIYKKLCELSELNFDRYIIKKLDDNWGKSKGGLNSKGSTIFLPKINFDERLAEFVGIVLGDGHIFSHKKGKKLGVYGIRIAGDLNKDEEYHNVYIKNLCKDIFNLKTREVTQKQKNNARFLDISSKELVNLFNSMGIKSGNKIKNQSTIPEWVFCNDLYLKACLRGLIDTDGSIFRMSNKDPNLIRINFTSYNITLMDDVRNAFIKLGFHPSKVILNRNIYLSRQEEIRKYLKEIGFSNSRHITRVNKFYSPMV